MDPQNQPPQVPSQSTIPDDSLAAALGFITTLNQAHIMSQQPQDGKTNSGQPKADQSKQSSPTPPTEAPKHPQDAGPKEEKARDDAMQKEIEDIRAELEKLKQEDQTENDTTGTTTEDTSTAS